MHSNIYLELIKMEHAERIRKAEQDRQAVAAIKAQPGPSFLKRLQLLLLALA